MSNLSLKNSLRTCKVDYASADRFASQRVLDPNHMICLNWNQKDLLGRTVCADSFKNKVAGCHDPLDRVNVENALRPQYAEYITLDTAGFNHSSTSMESFERQKAMKKAERFTTSGFGQQNSNHILQSCQARNAQGVQEGFKASTNKKCGGF